MKGVIELSTIHIPKGKADQRFREVVGILETDLNNAFLDFVTRLVEHGWSEADAKAALAQIVRGLKNEL